MTHHTPNRALRLKLLFALLCVCSLSTSGCFTRRSPGSHLVVHLSPPTVPAANTDQIAANPPELLIDESPAFPQLVFGHNAPARPRVAPTPPPEPSRSEKSPEPTIVPDVTTEEMVAARNESLHSLDIAERNLSLVSGKSLNAAQQDLVSKVRGFSDSAREAMRTGDWVRAKTLSKKAEVLSNQLASSL